MSKLSESWSYKLDIEDVTCAKYSSSFAVLALLPKASNEPIFQGKDGLILLFNATDPVPLVMWSVRKAKGGGLAFLKVNSPSFKHQSIFGGKSPQALLAYINANHEYILFDPYENDASELCLTRTKDHISADETDLGAGDNGDTSNGKTAEISITDNNGDTSNGKTPDISSADNNGHTSEETTADISAENNGDTCNAKIADITIADNNGNTGDSKTADINADHSGHISNGETADIAITDKNLDTREEKKTADIASADDNEDTSMAK